MARNSRLAAVLAAAVIGAVLCLTGCSLLPHPSEPPSAAARRFLLGGSSYAIAKMRGASEASACTLGPPLLRYELESVPSTVPSLFAVMKPTGAYQFPVLMHDRCVGFIEVEPHGREWELSWSGAVRQGGVPAWEAATLDRIRSRLGTQSPELRVVSGNANAMWLAGRNGNAEVGEFFNPTCLMDNSPRPLPRAERGRLYSKDELMRFFVGPR